MTSCFAFEGGVSTDPADGAVEITAAEYARAIEAVMNGKEITIDGGFAIRDMRPSEHHVWENGEWVDRMPEPEAPPEQSMQPLTARQLRLGLILNGFALNQVEATINAIDDPQARAIAEIEWEYAAQFERAHALIEEVGGALGLSAEQIDMMWEHALTL